MTRRQVLGLDPGFAAFGWSLLELGADAGGDRVVGMGVVRTKPTPKKRAVRQSDDRIERAREIAGELLQLVTDDEHDVVAICAESLQMMPRTGTKAKVMVGIAWGVVAAIAVAHLDLPILQCTPQEAKKAVTGSAAASKEDVQRALDRRYGEIVLDDYRLLAGLAGGVREHPYDALAAIVGCLECEPIRMARRLA